MLGRSSKYRVFAAVALALLESASAAAVAAPVVDSQAASPVTAVTREELEKLPSGRRVADLIGTCPGTAIPTVTRKPNLLIEGRPAIDVNCVQPDDVGMIEVYKAHNAARAEYGAPPLVWDPTLVLGAKVYGGQLARTGKMVHAPREGRGNVRENISQGMPGWSPRQLMASWLKEKSNFVPGSFPNVSRTGNWYDVGHWAQMIWIRTVAIGCARAAGIGSSWLVCRYGPGGNKDGELVGVPVPAGSYLAETPKLPPAEMFTAKGAAVAVIPPEPTGFLNEITFKYFPEFTTIYYFYQRDFIYPEPDLSGAADGQLTGPCYLAGLDLPTHVDEALWQDLPSLPLFEKPELINDPNLISLGYDKRWPTDLCPK